MLDAPLSNGLHSGPFVHAINALSLKRRLAVCPVFILAPRTPTQAVFHILDAPAHGREMHELGSRNDNWYESTMPGREAPLTEARKALVGLQENGVQRYMMCLLEKPHCAKMLRAFQETLREEGREKTPEDSLWLVDTEVERGEC